MMSPTPEPEIYCTVLTLYICAHHVPGLIRIVVQNQNQQEAIAQLGDTVASYLQFSKQPASLCFLTCCMHSFVLEQQSDEDHL